MKRKKKEPDERRYKWYRQRKKWGFDDRETWSLDFTIAKFVLPRLKRFRELTYGCPCGLCPGEYNSDVKTGMKKWHKILDDMIYAMEIMADEERWWKPETDRKKVQRGCELFGKWFGNLWW